MVTIYVSLILKRLKSIDDVPEVIRDKVLTALREKQNNETD